MEQEKINCGGSITVFMTLVFVVIFSLIIAVTDNTRVLSSKGYVAVAADAAAKSLFGNFNRELFEEYGLFGYGGCENQGEESFTDEFVGILQKNCAYRPENIRGIKSYSNLYHISDISVSMQSEKLLTDEDVLAAQIKSCVKWEELKKVRDFISDYQGGYEKSQTEEFDAEQLEQAEKYENGEYDNSEGGEVVFDKENDNGLLSNTTDKYPNNKNEIVTDEAGGNPLDTFRSLIDTGVLSLVCDTADISEEKIEIDDLSEDAEEKEENTSAASYIKKFISSEDELEINEQPLSDCTEKLAVISYINNMFSCYTENLNRTVVYGRELLISEKDNERANLTAVVKKILFMRMIVNAAYVYSDAALQEKSMVTAGAICGALGIAPLINSVQYTILAILAFEEACVEVCGLLHGKNIPIVKNKSNFKMNYSEICICTRQLFEKKAEDYTEKKSTVSGYMDYEDFLNIFLMLKSDGELFDNIKLIIQYDLRERFNQTFCIGNCISGVEFLVEYKITVFYALMYRESDYAGELSESVVTRYEYN